MAKQLALSEAVAWQQRSINARKLAA